MDDTLDDVDRTGFLLQRLQELKAWQREQEENLLREQELQIDRLVIENDDTADDDTTVDQEDLPSLNSDDANPDEDLPSWASREIPPKRKSLDDVPIVPKGKTFEQLLEEKLGQDDGKGRQFGGAGAREPAEDDEGKKKSFLRRGSGLVRYGFVGAPRKLTPKNLRRSRSLRGSATSLQSVDSKSARVTSANTTRKTRPGSSLSSAASCDDRLQHRQQPALVEDNCRPVELADADDNPTGLYDSVELSFMEKLARAGRQDTEDLKAFELLEEAACDSSFCSTSSTVKRLLVGNNTSSSLPSPIPKRSSENDSKVSSTPIKRGGGEDEDDDGDDLMNKIRAFLRQKGASVANSVSDGDGDDDTIVDDDYGVVMDAEPQILNKVSDEDQTACGPKKKNVRFCEEEMSFSPARIPKNSPSYLIWSIFTKERENRRKSKASAAKKTPPAQKAHQKPAPMSRVSPTESNFEAVLLNAKLVELEKEIEHFKKENANLSAGRRKLQQDRKQLAKDVEEFEGQKDAEKRKLDEDRRRFRREKSLFEKAQKDKRASVDKKTLDEIDELNAKVHKLTEEMQRKESKWAAAVSKLQEQVKLLEKENQQLHEDNHKLKLKGVSAKISTHLTEPFSQNNNIAANSSNANTNANNNNNDNNNVNGHNNNKNCGKVERDDEGDDVVAKTPRMSFSPADSLDSSMTLVSATTTTAAAAKVSVDAGRKKLVKTVARNEAKGTTEKVYDDGSLEICYSNGNRKEVTADGLNTKVLYYNGDVKETVASTGLVKYFYSQTKTWHLTYPDGREVLQFSNGQEEIRNPNGSVQITFADGSVKKVDVDGTEDIKFPDGTKVIVDPNGDRTLLLPSGQKEVHTSSSKRREYPDGTVKILYDDGKQETRYTSGRVRIKDKQGKLVHDSNGQMGANTIRV